MTARQDYAAEQARILAARVTPKVAQKAPERPVEAESDEVSHSESWNESGGSL